MNTSKDETPRRDAIPPVPDEDRPEGWEKKQRPAVKLDKPEESKDEG